MKPVNENAYGQFSESAPWGGFRTFIDSLHGFTEHEWQCFAPFFSGRHLERGAFFLTPETRPCLTGFIVSGLVRHFIHDCSGKECTTDFCREGEFSGIPDPVLPACDSQPYWIQALESTDLVVFDAPVFLSAFRHDMRIHRLLSDIMLPYFSRKCSRERHLLTLDPAAAYEEFLRTFPGLVDRIPQYHIASYLGITPETLSRIRKKRVSGS